jgi:hypothetical protein
VTAKDASVDRSAADAPDTPVPLAALADADSGASLASALALPAGPPERVQSAASLVTVDLGIPRAAPTLIALLVNVDAFRATSAASTVASIAATSSMLRDFVNGDLHIDWALLSGPSLDRMERDVALLRCGADDGAIDRWLDGMSPPGKGGPSPVSVPDVYAVSATIEFQPRVAMRVQHHLLAIVPPELADDAAHALSGASLPDRVDPREAIRMWERKSPTQSFPEFVAPVVTELRIWFEPGPGPSADAFVEEDTPTPAAAAQAADMMRKWAKQQSGNSDSAATGGLFNNVDVATRAKMATAHMHATREQVATTLGFLSRISGASRSRRP